MASCLLSGAQKEIMEVCIVIYFIADTHFGEENIRLYENRPFANITEMDNALKKHWNNRVSQRDDIYVLGDFGAAVFLEALKDAPPFSPLSAVPISFVWAVITVHSRSLSLHPENAGKDCITLLYPQTQSALLCVTTAPYCRDSRPVQ